MVSMFEIILLKTCRSEGEPVKKNWNEEELLANFMLMPNELHLSMGNKTETNRLGFAVLLKYFQQKARFLAKSKTSQK